MNTPIIDLVPKSQVDELLQRLTDRTIAYEKKDAAQVHRIQELELAITEILDKAEIRGYDGGHAGIEAICKRVMP